MSLIHPANLAKYLNMKSPGIGRCIPRPEAVEKVKRDLFGPVDRESAKSFAEREIAKHQYDASRRWNFDFIRGRPIINAQQQFVWERVLPQLPSGILSAASPNKSAIIESIDNHVNKDVPLPSSSPSPNQTHPQHIKNLNSLNNLLDKPQRLKQPQQLKLNKNRLNIIHTTDSENLKDRLRTATAASSAINGSPSTRRQPRITEYLKERKSVSPKSKKILRHRRVTIAAGALSHHH